MRGQCGLRVRRGGRREGFAASHCGKYTPNFRHTRDKKCAWPVPFPPEFARIR
jgi:hypothetical protein